MYEKPDEVQTRQSSQVQVQKTHSSILRLSLRQYVEQRTDITFTLLCFIFGTYAAPLPSSSLWNLCSASAIQPHFIQSHLICYLSLCTSATQLMCEPCNVLQSGPRFDFIQPFCFVLEPMQRLCHPAPYGPMQRLCHPAHLSLSLLL